MEPQTTHVALAVKTSPKDFFLHLLSMVALYASAVSFLMIVFSLINVYFPDVAQQNLYDQVSSLRDSIRGSLSSLIVFFPVFLVVTSLLNKSYHTFPEKRNLGVRKWLIYFTLFVGALVMMGYLVSAIYGLLGGELTLPFSLKVLSIFFVAGSIFVYYLSDIKKHGTE
ncbi:MAG: hypothetical protein KGI50_01875 [Patescibacteria group bacterium]|nr:hypothetical protein [Patescibacteria group bacterium]MDE2437907.1 hypothetical protein [Patescibacteria group bacterium]